MADQTSSQDDAVAPPAKRGSVTLVGGGPGAPGLITVAGREALAEADVVYFDRLAPHDDLSRWAPHAELIDVGKLPGFHKVTQEQINELLTTAALAGHRVVRLKGGDPFVFGRGSEEVEACRTAEVPVRVIPGITSAIAAPGAAGIPVTAREVARSFTVVTGHDPFGDEFSRGAAGIINAGGTLVILMGMLRLAAHLDDLRRAGLAANTPAAVIQECSTDRQRSVRATAKTLALEVARAGLTNPAVIVVGAVVDLGDWAGRSTPATSTVHPDD